MMKLIASVLVVLSCLQLSSQDLCTVETSVDESSWINLQPETKCYKAMVKQIQMEFDASYQYLALGSHFARDTINRMGAADMFFNAAKEEREHGTKLIEYLLMRGADQVSNLIKSPEVLPEIVNETTASLVAWTNSEDQNQKRMRFKTEWKNLAEGLKSALDLETTVTHSIRELIKSCEKVDNTKLYPENYYHLVDYLTGVYLEEQLKGQRDLAGKLSTLRKMMSEKTSELGEFLFDKTL